MSPQQPISLEGHLVLTLDSQADNLNITELEVVDDTGTSDHFLVKFSAPEVDVSAKKQSKEQKTDRELSNAKTAAYIVFLNICYSRLNLTEVDAASIIHLARDNFETIRSNRCTPGRS